MRLIERIRHRILIRRVNKALGIELYDWQIHRIFDDGVFYHHGRCVGVTTANVLRLLLNPKFECAILTSPHRAGRHLPDEADYVYLSECARAAYTFGQDALSPARQHNFIAILKKTRRALNHAGIKTNSLIIELY